MTSGRRRKTTESDRLAVHEAKRRGLSNRAIGEQLGLSHETVRRLAAEGPIAPPRPVRVDDGAVTPAAVLSAELPENATLADIEDMIRRTKAALGHAENDENLQAISALQARLQGWIDRREKFAPPAVADPNEAPDVVAAAAEARELIRGAVERAIARRAAG